MDRRTFLTGLGACSLQSKLAFSQPIDMCGVPFPDGTVGCRAGMSLHEALAVRANQRTEVWCWAASLEIIFRANGFIVPQERFVQAVYGQIVSLPAFTGYSMSTQLNREWTDLEGKRCQVKIEGLYDHDAGIGSITPAQIVSALRTGRPLLLCNTHHAMVLGIIDYFPGPQPSFHAAGLIDPWPYQDPSQGGTHGLTDWRDIIPIEQGGQMRYLALPTFMPA
jgi:hypothetical protein